MVFTLNFEAHAGGGGPTGVTSFDNLGSLGSNADAFYFQDNIPSNFVQNLTGIVNEAVLQNGTSSLDSQGEIRLGTSRSQFNFLHAGNVGSNLTSIVLWTNGDIEGAPEYPLIDTLNFNAGAIQAIAPTDGFYLATIDGNNFILSIRENDIAIQDFELFITPPPFIGLPINDNGNWHMIAFLMDKGNTTTGMAKICVDGSSNCHVTNAPFNQFTGTFNNHQLPLTIGSNSTYFLITENTFNVDELTIWNGYQLTPANIDAMWNSGAGASSVGIGDSFQVVRHTFDTAQAQFGGSPDIDSDGIFNEIDNLPNTFSNDFNDLSLGGTSDGSIMDRGNQVLTITEETNPDGIRVKADISGGVTPATVEFCSAMSSIDFDPGDESVVTCSSVTVTTISGPLSITFFGTDDTEATTFLTQGNSITFDQDTFSFTAPSTNAETVTVSVNGFDTPIEPGSTIIIPLNEDPDCTSAIPSQGSLWPPNHKFQNITIDGVTDPDGDPVTITIDGITQDEPTPGPGKKHSPDGDGVGTDTAEIRAERDGSGDGRVYEISFTADDGNGAVCTSSIQVDVPHDQSGDPAVDSGQNHDSTQ